VVISVTTRDQTPPEEIERDEVQRRRALELAQQEA
jgi:hypothetical protein